uniref:SFRICE_013565 n=1 Tax=Spodoptera frugiperda TaxID=7108 RepID=A0A2H1VSQ2_SPOFR
MRVFALVALCFASAAAVPHNPHRHVDGDIASINQYPSLVSMLYAYEWSVFVQECAGVIINRRSILTAAHCPYYDAVPKWRFRVGSSLPSSGGQVHAVNGILIHPSYRPNALDFDVAVLRSATEIQFNEFVQISYIPSARYVVPDNDPLWVAGWGANSFGALTGSEQLRHIQVQKLNDIACKNRYALRNIPITANMVCSGWVSGGRDQCQGVSGGPLYHRHNTVVGVWSFGFECSSASDFPSVSANVPRLSNWIMSNA